MDKSNGYLPKVMELLNKIETEQYDNIKAAAKLMADAIENDRLINVYGGGGHTTLPVGEMFFRAGGLCNINPCMETGLSVFNQAQKYLSLERCVNYGRHIMEYYNLQKDDVLIVYHNIGTNAATIDAVMQAKGWTPRRHRERERDGPLRQPDRRCGPYPRTDRRPPHGRCRQRP